MAITLRRGSGPCAPEEQVLAEMTREGFAAAVKDYASERTEPHRHEYDVSLYVIEGEFTIIEPDGAIHHIGPGDRAFVGRGTAHAEDHGALRMIVGRRH